MTEQFEEPKKWWHADSILLKSGVIAVLILLLLIPSSWIQELITEREGYQQQRVNIVTDKWADSQLVQGPVLLLPFKKNITENVSGKPFTHEVTQVLYVLPQNLHYKAAVKTEQFKKGIYDAVVYNSIIAVQGNFTRPDIGALGVDPSAILYDHAKLVFGLSDLKGLKNSPAVVIQGKSYDAGPAVDDNDPFYKPLEVKFPLKKDADFTFSYNLDVEGSHLLNFLHSGKNTEVEVNSDWPNPDFNGRYLPDNRVTNDKGFVAKWHMLAYNRPFPQQWVDDKGLLINKEAVTEAVFGVKLELPIDQYRKVMRTAKYSTLIILLTFVSLFLAELIRKQKVHVFNYTLIGAAMVIYYILLLSFSEQIGYNYAYLVSSVSTIGLISAFTSSLLGNKGVAVLFAFILSVFYGFIFILIQLEELSLMFGGIALFLVVATLMYFSRKIDFK